MTVQVLGTGQTGNWELSHWLTQFSMVLIGREESCDVETAAVKRAVRTWRPGKGCGRGAAREGWSGVGKTGKWWMRQRWTRACLLALQVTMKCKNGRGWGGCVAVTTIEILGLFSVAVEREEHGTSSGSDHDHSGEYPPHGHGPPFFS